MRALLVDSDREYLDQLAQCLRRVEPQLACEIASSDGDALAASPGAGLVVLGETAGQARAWWRLLPELRRRHAGATILLTSSCDEDELQLEAETMDLATKRLLESDPLVTYLPKGRLPADRESYLDGVAKLASEVASQAEDAKRLTEQLVLAAMEAAETLWTLPASELIREAPAIEALGLKKRKDDTLLMDVVAEECLKRRVLPLMHTTRVLVCTEELGMHNVLYHRLASPGFFVFSDPLDGSTALRRFLREVLQGAPEGTSLEQLIEAGALERWTHGHPGMNSPTISMALCERHRGVSAVLLNVFTKDMYLSTQDGNFAGRYEEVRRLGVWSEEAWTPFSSRAIAKGQDRLFLANMGSVDRREKGKSNWMNAHLEVCVYPLIPRSYSWQESFEFRFAQGEFTPGPGRILFLADVAPAREYNARDLGGKTYDCVLSSGELITEWAGWLCFARHLEGYVAYCLRRLDQPLTTCRHKRKPEDPATCLPDEVMSVFRRGGMDLMILHTAYRAQMRTYKDTLVVCSEQDADWMHLLRDPQTGEDQFVRIPLH